MNNKKIAILQSNYIPWKGYFDIINSVDEFIIYDEVQYTKNDWRNRNKIKTSNGIRWLTIPVAHSLSQSIHDTQTTHNLWRKKHWHSIEQSYGKAPFFSQYGDIFCALYNTRDMFLSAINHQFIVAINKMLGIKTKITQSTQYPSKGEATQRLVQICQQAGATEYVSGPRAHNYLQEDLFAKNDIRLTWFDYSGYPAYPQRFSPFEHAVSIIDLIFNTGPDAPSYMKSFGKS